MRPRERIIPYRPLRESIPPGRNSAGVIKSETEVFVGNLPIDTTEEDITQLFEGFAIKHIKKVNNDQRCFAFVDVGCSGKVQEAVRKLNRTKYKQKTITVSITKATNQKRKETESTFQDEELPALEKVEEIICTESLKNGSVNSEMLCCGSPFTVKEANSFGYAVPMEMRSALLLQMLKDCFLDLNWMASVTKPIGKAVVVVTDTVPKTPFFWAIHRSEETLANMHKLFSILAEAESKRPFLAKHNVKRGMRCLAECVLDESGEGAWNRCWILEVIGVHAVVLFVDYGHSAIVPVMSLRSLDDDTFWVIPPLSQPFMLQEDVFSFQRIIGRLLQGNITKAHTDEPHILRFSLSAENNFSA